MNLKCICETEFSASLGKVKCKKCGREYDYSRIAREAKLDMEDNRYILDETLLKVERKFLVSK